MSVPDLLDRIGGAAAAVVPAGTAVGVAVPTRAAEPERPAREHGTA